MAWALSRAGRIPSSRDRSAKATRALQVSMLGPDPWIIEPGRHAVGGLHLAVRVLEQIAEAAVEHARLPARERGGVPPRGEPLPRRLDPYEEHTSELQSLTDISYA